MANLIRYPGLELPVFDVREDEVVDCFDVNLGRARIPESDQFVRFVSLSESSARHVGAKTLKGFLEIADTSFQEVAGYVGSEVVRHTWGLIEKPINKPYWFEESFRSELVPESHILGAEVDRIIPRGKLSLDREQVDNIIKARRLYREEVTGVTWGDFLTEQFIHGYAPGDEKSKLWLVDIDPVMRKYEDRRVLTMVQELAEQRGHS